ncbi:MAG: carbon-nitrogen family hydrolase [Tepidisphaeraceae bacterium]
MSLSVACVQFDIQWHDKPANHARVRSLLASARVLPGSLVVLPEMFDVGFTMDTGVAQDEPIGPTGRFLSELASELKSTVIAGYVGQDDAGRPVNQAGVFSPEGRRVGRYIKTYPFGPGGEDKHYAAGHGPELFELDGVIVAPMICYDLRFPELFRTARERGAELFVLIANFPASRVEHWLTLARARAIENQAWMIAVNRIGKDPTTSYIGRTVVIEPQGTIVADAGSSESVLKAEIDVNAARTWREQFPVWRDVR